MGFSIGSLSANSSTPALFTPIRVGNAQLQHRVVMAPLTRYRASDDHTPSDLQVEYYSQRASTPGTLLITEATYIAPKAGGYENAPGIWSVEQAAAWKKVTDAVHERGSSIFLQLWALGRAANPAVLAKEAEAAGLDADAYPYVSASDVALKGHGNDKAPRPLTEEEIDEYVELYAHAAKLAVNEAGFDGVEIHNANGYLLDQFLQDVTNKRTDAYGGSVAARAKFPLRVADAIVSAIGASRTAIRISPWSDYQEMGMSDPIPTFSYFISELRKRFPELAYLHAVEGTGEGSSNDFARKLWREGAAAESSVFLSAGNHDRKSALLYAQEKGDLAVFGRDFISNPDLPLRLKEDLPLTPYDYSTFYTKKSAKGYTDYPFYSETSSTVKRDEL